MIAFYAFSNMTVINTVAIKLQFFRDEQADLFLQCSSSISENLLCYLKQQHIFNDICIIDTPALSVKNGLYGRIPKVRSILYAKTLLSYYRYFIDRCIPQDQSYDRLITAYLGRALCYPAYCLLKRNSKMKISFMEEGFFHYCRPTKSMWTCIYTYNPNLRERVATNLREMPYIKKLKKALDYRIYLRIPDALPEPEKFNIQKLNAFANIEGGMEILQNCEGSVAEENLRRYEECSAVYLGQCISQNPTAADRREKELLLYTLSLGQRKEIIVKAHVSSEYTLKNYGKDMGERAYFDRDVYIFESLLSRVETLDNKLFISSNSSVLAHLKTWFDKEPYIMYTHRLFPEYSVNGDYYLDHVVECLRKLYREPSKVMAPNNMLEYQSMLQKCMRRIHATRYNLPFHDEDDMMNNSAFAESYKTLKEEVEQYRQDDSEISKAADKNTPAEQQA